MSCVTLNSCRSLHEKMLHARISSFRFNRKATKEHLSRILSARRNLGRAGHGGKKLRVCLGLGEAAQQKFHGFHGRERAQDLSQYPDAIQLVRRQEQFVFAGSGAVDIDGGEHALVDQAAVEIDFHITRSLKFFDNDVVHAAAGIDKGCGDDGKRATLFDVLRGGEKAARALQSVSVNTAGKNFARGRCTAL